MDKFVNKLESESSKVKEEKKATPVKRNLLKDMISFYTVREVKKDADNKNLTGNKTERSNVKEKKSTQKKRNKVVSSDSKRSKHSMTDDEILVYATPIKITEGAINTSPGITRRNLLKLFQQAR